MINRHIHHHHRRRSLRTDAARTKRQLRRLIQEASAQRNELQAVAAQANWWR